MKCILLLIIMASSLIAAKVPDGAWNGKPWKKSELLAGVKNGDADALAEWAYCSRQVFIQIPYDPELIYRRAKEAADKGSINGRRLVAKCYQGGIHVERDKKKAGVMFEELAAEGFPDAMVDRVGHYLNSSFTECDYEKIEKLMSQAEALGCIWVASYRATILARLDYPGRKGRIDRAEIVRLLVKSFRLYNTVWDADRLIFYVHSDNDRSVPHIPDALKSIVTEEDMKKAFSRIEEAAALKHPTAQFNKGWYELLKGDVHKGVPLMIRSSNAGEVNALHNLTRWFSHGYKLTYAGDKQILVIGNSHDTQVNAKYAYSRGSRSDFVRHHYASYLSEAKGEGRDEKIAKAKEIFRGLIKDGGHYSHNALAVMLIQENHDHDGRKEDADLGFDHLIYYSKVSAHAEFTLALFYASDVKDPSHDPVKGIAVSKNTLKRQKGSNAKYTQRWIRKEKKLNAAQKEEIKQLVEDGFPRSEKFRRPAFERLQEAGHIPSHWEFDQQKEKKH